MSNLGLRNPINIKLPSNYIGPQGTQGIQGIQGPAQVQGTQGAQGTQGLQGIQGILGTQGIQGNQGLQGIQGTQGFKGLTGVQGSQGLQGLQGIQGLQGTQGSTGIQGIQGSTGIQGIQGTQGLQGSQGLQGIQGLLGIQGSKGTQGIQGIQGTQGTQGVQGVQGIQGIQGSIGIQGTQGVQGTIGTEGNFGGLTFEYVFDGTVSDSSPSTNNIKLNSSPQSSSSVLKINNIDNYNNDISSYLSTLNVSTSNIKGHIKIYQKFDNGKFLLFSYSGSSSDTDIYNINITHIDGSSASPFTTSNTVLVSFVITGDKGDVGDTTDIPDHLRVESLGVGVDASTVSGEIRALDVEVSTTSDMRLKENITVIQNSLEKIRQINGYEFDWISNPNIHSHTGNDIGLLAQEVEQISAPLITERKDGFKAVYYTKLIPMLVQCIKELDEKIEKVNINNT